MSTPRNNAKPKAPPAASPRPPFGDITNTTHPGNTAGTSASSGPSAAAPSHGNAPASDAPSAPGATKLKPVAEILAEWKRKTPAEKEEWNQKTYGSKEPPWEGEVDYDDEGDIEYEESMASGRQE